jgi:hypothetical protein
MPQSATVAGTPVDRDLARAALAANLAVLPGLGSLLLGRRAGWLQAALAVCGFLLTLSWLALVLAGWWRDGALPVGHAPRLGLLGAGVALFGGAWAWALSTALDAVRGSSGPASGKSGRRPA